MAAVELVEGKAMADWADELAERMRLDATVMGIGDPLVLEIWAARLRLVRQEGHGEGIEACRQILTNPATKTITFTDPPKEQSEAVR